MSNITAWHEYPYNFSGGQEVNGIASFFNYVDVTTNHMFGIVLLVGLWVIMVMAMKLGKTENGMRAATFITFILSLFLMRVGMISIQVVIFIGIVLIVAMVDLRDKYEKGL